MKQLKNITISDCATFHLLDGIPLYSVRFLSVLKFSSIGLAAVQDSSGAYHIKLNGNAAYSKRYDKTYGFYCGLVAVALNQEYFHIKADGERIYPNTFSWVGNFQEDLCVVKDGERFYHIDKKGYPIYPQKYDYVGDFKDGVAVIYEDGLATHINNKGQYLHNKWFEQLDIYHKGYARAKDDKGWFHIDKQGNALYPSRYKNIEAFYNELAKVETFDDAMLQITPSNEIVTTIVKSNPYIHNNQLSDDMVGFWKTFVIFTGVKLDIFKHLPSDFATLKDMIKIPGDNLLRILRALWEMQLITYHPSTGLWSLTEKGRAIPNTFLEPASILWAHVAAQNWLQLPELLKYEIKSHASFKDMESDEQNTIAYLNALEGYAVKDVGHYFKSHPILDKNIIGFGRTSLCLIKHLLHSTPYIDATVFPGFNIPKDYLGEINIKVINSLGLAREGYEIGLFFRFLHYLDDKTALSYLKKAHDLKIKKLIILETLIDNESPIGGLLDINMIIETGSKLRTFEEWQKLLSQSNYLVTFKKAINPYLTLLEVESK
ncbi:MAG: hypothetical protein K0R73_987 [Candidatus Midichloriaceae bacterium]|jgi:hypothetical protein|nr:hypothetical protein [Candidatus Midichloriaceae bacterium]